MPKPTIALLSGGTSSERDISLAGGEEIYKTLDKNKYQVRRYDPKTDLARLVRDAPDLDLAFVLLHGLYGEDGSIQGLLDLLGVPYQCSGVLGSALSLNKLAAKKIYEQAGLPIAPYHVLTAQEQMAQPRQWDQTLAKVALPAVVKPACGGSSIGMSIANDMEELKTAVSQAFQHDPTILLEAYIEGTELTGGVLGNDILEALPIVEIIPDSQYHFFDYAAKYTVGATTEICPARISASLAQKVQDYARRAHQSLFCKGYSRTDMIARGDDIFILETNTIPGMVSTSLLPLAARAAGISFGELVDRLIQLGLEQRKT